MRLSASSVITWGTSLSLPNFVCVVLSRSAAPQKRTDMPLPFCSSLSTWLFIQRSRKRRPAPCPGCLARRSRLSARRGSRQGARLVKSMWNTDSYFKRPEADSCSHHPQVRTVKSCRLFEASSVFKIFIVLKYGDHGRRLFICAPGLQLWAQLTYECHTMVVSLFHLILNGKSQNIFTAEYKNALNLIIWIFASEFNASNSQ